LADQKGPPVWTDVQVPLSEKRACSSYPPRDIVDVYARDIYGGSDGIAKALHMWGSGVVVIPPGTTMDGVEWF
jgi:hypothetical protein